MSRRFAGWLALVLELDSKDSLVRGEMFVEQRRRMNSSPGGATFSSLDFYEYAAPTELQQIDLSPFLQTLRS
jgi:hypothetical protein